MNVGLIWMLLCVVGAGQAERMKRHVPYTAQRPAASQEADIEEPRVKIFHEYPIPEWMRRTMSPKDYPGGFTAWSRDNKRCSAATALANDLCDGLLQSHPDDHEAFHIEPENYVTTSEDKERGWKAVPHGNLTKHGIITDGTKMRFWAVPSEDHPHLRLHPNNGEVEAKHTGTFLVTVQVTFNSLGTRACFQMVTAHAHRDHRETIIKSAIHREADNVFNSCVTNCTKTYTFRSQMTLSAVAIVRLRAGERVWVKSCDGYHGVMVVLTPSLTNWSLVRLH
jgi:hypothetical protein